MLHLRPGVRRAGLSAAGGAGRMRGIAAILALGGHACFACTACVAAESGPEAIRWTATKPDCATKELCGYELLPNRTKVEVYHATKEIGSYNHAAMLAYHDGRFLLTWKNSPRDEDSPGQRIMYSQSEDGLNWTSTSSPSNGWQGGGHTGPNVLFPNISVAANPARLFATPPVVVGDRLYAGASPKQMCLFPDQYESVLLLRQVHGNGTGQLGPIFWASDTIPPGFEAASSMLGIRTASEMDAQTAADVVALNRNYTSPAQLPCGNSSTGTLKCEACLEGCQEWSNIIKTKECDVGNERTHFTVPNSTADVILYRTHTDYYCASHRASPADKWSTPVKTEIPDVRCE